MTEDLNFVGVETCFICGKDKGLLLNRRLKKTFPHKACYNKEPCDECKAYMQQGVILISVQKDTDHENPYRTGGWCVIKDEAISKMFGPDSKALKSRVAFVEDDAWDKMGLPRGEQNI